MNNVLFRTSASQERTRSSNSVAKSVFDGDGRGDQMQCYGWIKKMFYHQIYPGGSRRVVVKCEWLDNVDSNDADDDTSMLPQARRNSQSPLNSTDPFVFLDECEGHNIMLCSHDPTDPNCDLFDIIDRHMIFN